MKIQKSKVKTYVKSKILISKSETPNSRAELATGQANSNDRNPNDKNSFEF